MSPLVHASLTLLGLAISGGLRAQIAAPPTASDWGGAGLLQTPSARMADEGELSLTASHTSPYSRYTVALQPLPWLEGAFRYVSVANRRYGPESLSGSQNYKDKSIDVKVRLLQETRWWPDIALGARDVGGTGLFASEYLVASKRFGPLDTSLGLATGYIGNRGGIGNPLRMFDDRFQTRPRPNATAGELNAHAMFRGPVGIFGGVAYQTPWEPLQIKLEYDGNDYRHEPQQNHQRQRSPLNIGASVAANENLHFHLGWERGNEAMFGVTLRGNLAKARPTPKPFDPPPVALMEGQTGIEDDEEIPSKVDWPALSSQLEADAGLRVSRIYRHGPELIVSGEQRRFLEPMKGFGRAGRILDHNLPADIRWLTVQNTRLGIPVIESSVERSALRAYQQHRFPAGSHVQPLKVDMSAPTNAYRHLVFEAPARRFGGAFDLGYRQTLGGPDGFVLFQLAGLYNANLRFTPNLWLSGSLSYNLYNNYDRFRYDAPSRLPRVRTDVRRYLTDSDLTLPSLQLTATRQLGPDLYAMTYTGLFESMYGGVGAEVLYRPFQRRWAVGADLNSVRQRGFEQKFSFRDNSTVTGHASLYYMWGDTQKVLSTLSAGRYLAKDWGATLSVGRVFDNGTSMGAYATRTDVSSRDFGEGSFDKGIYLSVPFDLLLPRSTRARANLMWNPLYRDGGARLSRNYSLYQMTSERDAALFPNNLPALRD